MKLRKLFKKLRSRTSFWKSSFLKPPGAKGSPTSSWKLYFQKFRAKKQVLIPIIIVALFLTALIFSNALASLGFFSIDSLNKGLVGHWPLDGAHLNSTTNRVDDISGYANHGTNSGATLTTDRYGQSNGAMSFNGSSYVKVNVDSWIRDVSYVTISGWYYHNSNTNGAPWGIMTDVPALATSDGFWWHLIYSGTTFYLRTEDNINGEGGYTGTPFVSSGNWYHLTTIVGTNKFDVYVNGVLYKSWTPGNGFSWANINNDTAYLTIGYSYTAGINGSIQDARLYNRALDTDEITRLYESYKPKMSVGSLNQKLVGHWPLRPDSEKVGSEMVTNGTFDSGTGWNLETGWTIAGGKATSAGSNASYAVNSSSSIGAARYQSYSITFDIVDYTSGVVRPNLGAYETGSSFSAVGTYTDIITPLNASTNGKIYFLSGTAGNEFIGSIDNVKVKELHTADTTPNTNHGTIYGANIRNHGAKFDGSDYVTISNYGNELGSSVSALSVSMWFKLDTAANDGLFSIGSFAGGHGKFDISTVTSQLRVTESIAGNQALFSFTDTSKWHHVVATYEGGTALRIYLDGVLKNSDTTGVTASISFSGNDLQIGNFWDTSGNYNFPGSISDVKIYTTTLSAPQVLDLYNGEDVSGAVFDMPLSDKTGFKDISGNANHGTNNGASIIGEAASFDGTNDYVGAVENGTLDLPSAMTVGIWFRANALGSEIICKSASDANENFRVYVGSNYVYFDYGTGSQYAATSAVTITTGTWYHLVGTVVAGSAGKIYINGQEASSYSTQAISPNPLLTNDNSVEIGKCAFIPRYFNGQISDVHIYSRALSTTETASLYAKGRSGSSVGMTTGSLNKGLIGQWDLKSKNEKVGSELVNNWSFDTGTDWAAASGAILNISAGQADITAVSTSSNIYQNIAPITASINKNYILTIDVASLNDTLLVNFNGVAPSKTITTAGVHQLAFTWDKAYGASVRIYPSRTSGVGNAVLNSLSIKELQTADTTPNTNHGTIYGATVGTSSTIFDGSKDYIKMDVGDQGLSGDQTLVAWIKHSATNPNPHQTIICTDTRYQYGIKFMNYYHANVLGFWIGNGSSNTFATVSTNVNDDQWHFVVASYNYNSGEVIVYKDGQAYTPISVGQWNVSPGSSQGAIGAEYHGIDNDYSFSGSIANVKIYDRALSLNEINSLFDKERGQFGI